MALKSISELSKVIASIKSSGARLDKAIQSAAVQAIGYSVVHRDVRPANDLYNAMPNGSRRASLVAFLEKHGNFCYMTTEKSFQFFENNNAQFDDVAEKELLSTPWHEAKKEVIVSEYDVDKSFQRFLKQVEKAIADGVEVKGIEKFKALKEANAKYESDLIVEGL